MLVRIWPRWCFLIAPGLRVLGLFYGGDNYCDSGGSNLGIGYLMMSASSSMNMPLVFAGLMVIGVMGVVMYELFALVERRLTGWAHRNPNAPH